MDPEFKKVADFQKFKVMIVDDEVDARAVIVDALEDDYQVLQAKDGEEALRLALELRPDLILLDVNMPGKNGIWACRELRTSDDTRHIPILVLSSRHELEQKLEAYAVGADDYLEKPFTLSEMKAKIGARLRRLSEQMPKDIRVGNLILHANRMEAEINGQRTSLSVLETKLLWYFLENKEDVLPRRKILSDVWKDVNVSGRTVDAHIVSLRRKVANFDHEITTIYGAGYALRPKGMPSTLK